MNDLHLVLLCAGAIAAGPAAMAHPQHDGHQTSAVTPTAPPNPRCAEAGRKALAVVSAIDTRSGSQGTARDAQRELAELQRAVSAAEAELFTCKAAVSVDALTTPAGPMAGMDRSTMNHSTMDMGTVALGEKPAAPGGQPAATGPKPADPRAGMDHSKMNMGAPAAGGQPPAAGTKPAVRGAKPAADPMAGMDHSKMNMGAPAAGAQPPAKGTKPAVRGAKPADPMAGMDHSKMGASDAPSPPAAAPSPSGGAGKLPVMMAERIADPGCPDTVGQAGAPKAVFARKVYYFCSVAARDEFRKDPAGYLKKHPR